MFAIDKITGNRVQVLGQAVEKAAKRCMVIKHTDGSIQVYSASLLNNFTNK